MSSVGNLGRVFLGPEHGSGESYVKQADQNLDVLIRRMLERAKEDGEEVVAVAAYYEEYDASGPYFPASKEVVEVRLVAKPGDDEEVVWAQFLRAAGAYREKRRCERREAAIKSGYDPNAPRQHYEECDCGDCVDRRMRLLDWLWERERLAGS